MINIAEISDGYAVNGSGEVREEFVDMDSPYDTDPSNDNQPENPGDPTDDEVDQDGVNGPEGLNDEDDHDIAGITLAVFDLALTKSLNTIATTLPVIP